MNVYDLVIIGGGPAGLSAAVNASSENLKTLLLDGKSQLGGQAGTSSNIENYAGFPRGVTGQDLADRMQQQASRFKTDMIAPVTAGMLQRDETSGLLTVTDDSGDSFTGRSVALAMGVQYRRLQLMNLVSYLNKGVSYGSPSLQSNYTNQELLVVGGANSAGQAAVHLAQCEGCTVHLIIRGGSIGDKMSHYLVEKIQQTPNIEVHTKAEITDVAGDCKLETVTVTTPEGDVVKTADQMFIMIGAVPKTTWLVGTLELDRNYVLAGRDLTDEARARFVTTCGRQPFDSETSLPGVFVIGDVRAGAVRRVAAAVGAGSMVIPDIHRHLAAL